MKRKSDYFLMKSLALALALLLTLGNLPLISFAEGVGNGTASLPTKQGEGGDYKYSFRAEIFFATGHVYPNNHYSSGGFWPEWGSHAIHGMIYSNKVDFANLGTEPKHYVVGTTGFSAVEDAVVKLNYDGDKVTNYFNKDQINDKSIKEALISEIKRVHNNTQEFITIDHKGNEVIIDPDELIKDEFEIKLFRYANAVQYGKVHLDLHIERPDARPIHVIEVIEGEEKPEVTYKEKYGTVLGKRLSHKIVKAQIWDEVEQKYVDIDPNIPIIFNNVEKKVKVWYEKKMSLGIKVVPTKLNGTIISDQEKPNFENQISFKNNGNFENMTEVGPKHIVVNEEIKIGAPDGFEVEKVLHTMKVKGKNKERVITPEDGVYKVKHEENEVVLKVYYKSIPPQTHIDLKAFIIKDNGEAEELNDAFKAEIGQPYSLETMIAAADAEGFDFQGYKINDPDTGDILDGKTIPSETVTKDLKNVYLYFVKKPVLKVGKVTIQYKEGANDIDASLLTGAPTELSGNVGEEKTFKTPVIKGYSLNSVSVDGTVLSPGNDGDYSVTLKDTPQTVVVDYKKLNQLSPGITLILNNGEDTPTETELPQANIGEKYEVKVPDYFDVVSITILEEGSTQPTVIEASSLTSDQLQEYLKLEYKNVKQTVTVVYQRKTSDIKVIEYLNDTEIATNNEKAPFGKDYTIPINPNYNLIKVDLTWVTGEILDFKFPEFEPVEEKYEIKIYYKNKDNGGNNNNNNNNDNGGNNNNNNNNDNGGNNNNNDNANSGDTDNRDRYEYQEYNPDKENVIIKDDKAPLGQLNTDSYYAYIQGYPDGSVKPGAYVSRQETAAIFFRLLNPSYRETIRTDENSFSDVDKNTWSNKHISTLAKGGIIVGYEDGTFRPKQIITRAELISIASKFDKLDGNAKHNFKDVAGHWAEKQIAEAAQKGTISGYLNGEFAPDKPVTRAEFAKIVNKVLKRNVKKEEVLPGVKQFTDLQSDMWYYEDMVTATNSYNATRGDDGYQKWTELIKIFIEM